ncbi:hydrogenase [Thermocrinis ruber]|uniref:Hydrogenase n=1 Tax=Thermocrinis ruber TaxID=75906 RepID=W0DGV6_9AQUI|nr:hydrogenase nickel incorporation protein HypB [Thermocrinis ruber]AHE96115.1 hydrogenase [Thermocrinis ruber]
MCKECGCGEENHRADRKVVQALTKVLDANDRQAQENREHFEKHGVYAINLMSSPGAGKTSLIEATVEALKDQVRIGVIEGDLETDLDAQRIKNKGAPAYQITTGGACHLDAFMVHEGIHNLPLENLDIVFIENVGNLVCPASYDVGAHMNVVLLAVTEGDDKPEKYPVMFRNADLLVITKTDLLPYVDFSIERAVKSARKIKPNIDFIALSCKTKEGLEDWLEYIKLKVRIAKKSFMA